MYWTKKEKAPNHTSLRTAAAICSYSRLYEKLFDINECLSRVVKYNVVHSYVWKLHLSYISRIIAQDYFIDSFSHRTVLTMLRYRFCRNSVQKLSDAPLENFARNYSALLHLSKRKTSHGQNVIASSQARWLSLRNGIRCYNTPLLFIWKVCKEHTFLMRVRSGVFSSISFCSVAIFVTICEMFEAYVWLSFSVIEVN